MYALRRWSVRHARGLNWFYRRFESFLVAGAAVALPSATSGWNARAAAMERVVKGALFDCKMCGQCVLSATGMSCPMNCPKQLRNGPCGGVRENGNCEVRPEMRCVWVEAVEGAARIPGGEEALHAGQPPVDRRLQGRSSWLRVVQEKRRTTP